MFLSERSTVNGGRGDALIFAQEVILVNVLFSICFVHE